MLPAPRRGGTQSSCRGHGPAPQPPDLSGLSQSASGTARAEPRAVPLRVEEEAEAGGLLANIFQQGDRFRMQLPPLKSGDRKLGLWEWKFLSLRLSRVQTPCEN